MVAKIQEQFNMFDILKWVLVLILIVGGLSANYYFAEQPLPIHIIGWLILAPLTLFIFFQTEKGRVAWDFLRDARVEMKKIIWPSRQETVQTSVLVIGLVIIMGLILWCIDSILLWIVSKLTS